MLIDSLTKHRSIDLAQLGTGCTTIVITLSNQQGYVSNTSARQSLRPAASRPAAARSVPVGRSRREPAVPSAACRPCHPGTWPDWISAPGMCRSARLALRPRRAGAPRRRTGPAPMMNWAHGANWRRGARRQLRPSARRAAQGTGTHLVREYRRDPRRRRTGPAQADRLHQRQKSAVKLQIWHAVHRRRGK